MNIFHAFILGIIQGLTEFIPVSSTAHLLIAGRLMNIPSDDASFAFNILVQLGTTLALILIALWRGVGIPPEDRPSNLFLVVLAVVTAAVTVTAYFGAENVYRYGIGVLGRAAI